MTPRKPWVPAADVHALAHLSVADAAVHLWCAESYVRRVRSHRAGAVGRPRRATVLRLELPPEHHARVKSFVARLLSDK